MFYVGIDVASEKHDCCILSEKKKVIQSFSFSNSYSGYAALLTALEKLPDLDEIRIGLEATGIYSENLAVFLRRKGFDVTTINPLLIKKHQCATTLRKTKTDKADAKGIALFIAEEDFQPDLPVSYHIQELKSLTRARFSVVQDRSALKNKVKRLVVLLFPELLGEFSDLFGTTATALLKQYPSAAKLAACRFDTLAELLRKNSRGRFGKAKAEHLKELAKKSVGNHSPARAMELKMLLARIEFLSSQIDEYEEQIKIIMNEIDSPILSVPGISYTLGAIIVAEIGSIQRFSSPAKLLAFAGLEPSLYQSGKFTPSSGKMVKRGSPILRWALLQAAGFVPNYSPTFALYRSKKLEEGKSATVVRSHIAKKLVRVIYSLLSHSNAFSEHLAA